MCEGSDVVLGGVCLGRVWRISSEMFNEKYLYCFF